MIKKCISHEELSLGKIILGIMTMATFKWVLSLIDKGMDKARAVQLGICIFLIPWGSFFGWEDSSFKIPIIYFGDIWYLVDIIGIAFFISVIPLVINGYKNKIFRHIQLCLCLFFVVWFVFAGWEDPSFKIPPEIMQPIWYTLDILVILTAVSLLPLIYEKIKIKYKKIT